MLPVLSALALIGAAHAAPVSAQQCDGCSVLWIVIDTTRADRVGCFGGRADMTPNIDGLCARGVAYQFNYAQAPPTMLSVGSYFSGRYRRSTGMDFMLWEDQDFHPMSDQITTLAEVLSDLGFQTVGLTANPMISDRKHQGRTEFNLNYSQGFDSWSFADDVAIEKKGPVLLEQLAKSGDRFFLYLHAMGPHFPNARLPGFEKRQGARFPKTLAQADQDFNYTEINRGKLDASGLQGEYLRALYDDNLWQADQRVVGTLLAKVKSLGLEDRLLIVVSSDHGEALGEQHEKGVGTKQGHMTYWGHSHPTLVDATLHVPLVFSGPGLPANVKVKEQIAENVDIAPTIVNHLGIPLQSGWGWDGAPLFGPGAVASTWSIADQGAGKTARSAARTFTQTTSWYESWNRYLYYDRSGAGPRKMVAATAEHNRLEGVLKKYVAGAHPPAADTDMAAPEGEFLDQLKALGYMDE
ncbi:MAG: sulfatase [Myxococcota bacterium]|nr:sulfatase [Myxococcota bacterium]